MPNAMAGGSSGLMGAGLMARANVGPATGKAGGSFNIPKAQSSPGGFYGGPAASSMAGAPSALLMLVLIEAGLLIVLRRAFSRHHGG